jgi:hypothetical protein
VERDNVLADNFDRRVQHKDEVPGNDKTVFAWGAWQICPNSISQFGDVGYCVGDDSCFLIVGLISKFNNPDQPYQLRNIRGSLYDTHNFTIIHKFPSSPLVLRTNILP